MRIPLYGTSKPMNSAAYVDTAEGWAKRLEDREAARSGTTVAEARRVIATRTTVAPGTLENLRKGRLKAIAAHVYERLRASVIKELEAEVRALEHELQLLRATGADPRHGEIDAVVASLASVRKALGLED